MMVTPDNGSSPMSSLSVSSLTLPEMDPRGVTGAGVGSGVGDAVVGAGVGSGVGAPVVGAGVGAPVVGAGSRGCSRRRAHCQCPH